MLRPALACCALALGLTTEALAQDDVFGSVNDQRFLDAAYDYELWVADARTATGWFVELWYPDGTLDLVGPFATETAAQKHVDFTMKHSSFRRDGMTPEVLLDEKTTEPNWVYFDTYGALAEAQTEAEWFESIGMLTDIRRKSTLRQPARRW